MQAASRVSPIDKSTIVTDICITDDDMTVDMISNWAANGCKVPLENESWFGR